MTFLSLQGDRYRNNRRFCECKNFGSSSNLIWIFRFCRHQLNPSPGWSTK